jgi:hypothetical protein
MTETRSNGSPATAGSLDAMTAAVRSVGRGELRVVAVELEQSAKA